LAIATPKNQDGPNGNAEDVALVGDTVVFVYGLGFVQAKATHHLHKRTDLDDRRWVSCTPDWCPAPGYLEVVLGDHLFYLGTPPGSPALQDRRFVTKAPLVGEDEGASVAVSGVLDAWIRQQPLHQLICVQQPPSHILLNAMLVDTVPGFWLDIERNRFGI
jgi:hypothetical protein